MSHTPEHGAHRAGTADRTDRAEAVSETTSEGNSLGLSLVLFLVLFIAFIGGLYIMSFLTPVLFLAGLAIVLLALFGTFTIVPHFLT